MEQNRYYTTITSCLQGLKQNFCIHTYEQFSLSDCAIAKRSRVITERLPGSAGSYDMLCSEASLESATRSSHAV